LLLLVHAAAAEVDIILLGDSWAEFAGDSLEAWCARAGVVANKGVGGSTAAEWAGAGCEWAWAGSDSDRRRLDARRGPGAPRRLDACSAEDAFADGVAYSRAWVSLGGNDALQNNCEPAAADVLAKALTEIATAAPAGLRVLVTGYGSVAERTEEEGCEPPDIERTNAAIRDAVRDLDFVDYVDVLDAFGGSAAAYSSWAFYEDAIHLNERGYERLFTLPAVQEFFECDTAAPTPMPVEDSKETPPPTPAVETTTPPTPAEEETPSPTPGTPGKETSPSPAPSPTPESDAALPRAGVAAVVAAAAVCFGAF